MLIKYYLRILDELATEFDLRLSVVFVPSERNRADVLTRVKETWLQVLEDLEQGVAAVFQLSNLELERLYAMPHMGVDKTLFLTRKVLCGRNQAECTKSSWELQRVSVH